MIDAKRALVLLAAGKDRPGIVDQVSGVVYRVGCNLEDSRMSVLGGEFALIILVTGADAQLATVEAEMGKIGEDLGLTVQCKRAALPSDLDDPRGPGIPYVIRVVAVDHPGIVHKLTRLLAGEGANVLRLDTTRTHAPTTGTPMFSVHLEIAVPIDVPVTRLRKQLEGLGDEENLDIEIHAASA